MFSFHRHDVCEQPGSDQRNFGALPEACMARAKSRAVGNGHSGALSAYYPMALGHAQAVTASNKVK
jgi:hypothetical protein